MIESKNDYVLFFVCFAGSECYSGRRLHSEQIIEMGKHVDRDFTLRKRKESYELCQPCPLHTYTHIYMYRRSTYGIACVPVQGKKAEFPNPYFQTDPLYLTNLCFPKNKIFT